MSLRPVTLTLALAAAATVAPTRLPGQLALAPVAARLPAVDSVPSRPPGRSLFATHDAAYPRWQEETAHFLDRGFAAMLVNAPVFPFVVLAYMHSPRGAAPVVPALVLAGSMGMGAALPRGHSECTFLHRMGAGTLGALAGGAVGHLVRARGNQNMGAELYWGAIAGAALAHPRCGGRY